MASLAKQKEMRGSTATAERCKRLFREHKRDFWFAGGVILLLLMALFIYRYEVVDASKTPYAIMDGSAQDTNLGEIADSTVRQMILVSTDDPLEAMGLQFATYQQVNQGTVDVQVADSESGEIVYSDSVDMAQLEDNKFYTFSFDEPIVGMKGRFLEITLRFSHASPDNQITLWVDELASYQGNMLNVDGQIVKNTRLSFQLFSGDCSFLLGTYWLMIAILAVGAIGVYFVVFYTKARLEWIFVVLVMVSGFFYQFLLTPFSSPDEPAHIDTAYRYSNVFLGNGYGDEEILKRIGDQEGSGLSTQPSVSTYRAVHDGLFQTTEDTALTMTTAGGVSTPFWLYLPSSLGITLGRLLNVGYIPLLYLGRVFNFAAFTIMVFFAIRRTPVGKLAMLVAALLPMSMQLAVSFSYDAIINGVAFLFIANCLHAAYGKEPLRVRDLVALGVLGLLLAPCKSGAYLPLCFLCLIIPRDRWGSKKRHWLALGVILGASLLSFATYSLQSVLSVLSAGEKELIYSGDAGYTFGYLLQHPDTFIRVMVNTVMDLSSFYYSSLIGKELSWFSVPIDLLVVTAFTVLLLLSALRVYDEHQLVKQWHKWWIVLIFAGVFLLVEIAMFTNWTPLGDDTVAGVQGRYFLPVLPILLLLVRNSKLTFQKDPSRGIAFGVFAAQVAAMFSLFRSVLAPALL